MCFFCKKIMLLSLITSTTSSQEFSYESVYNLWNTVCFFCSAEGVEKQWEEFKDLLSSLKFDGNKSVLRRWDTYMSNG